MCVASPLMSWLLGASASAAACNRASSSPSIYSGAQSCSVSRPASASVPTHQAGLISPHVPVTRPPLLAELSFLIVTAVCLCGLAGGTDSRQKQHHNVTPATLPGFTEYRTHVVEVAARVQHAPPVRLRCSLLHCFTSLKVNFCTYAAEVSHAVPASQRVSCILCLSLSVCLWLSVG